MRHHLLTVALMSKTRGVLADKEAAGSSYSYRAALDVSENMPFPG